MCSPSGSSPGKERGRAPVAKMMLSATKFPAVSAFDDNFVRSGDANRSFVYGYFVLPHQVLDAFSQPLGRWRLFFCDRGVVVP